MSGHVRYLASAIGACLALLIWMWLFWGWVYDDAYIAFRFSDNWASGQGLTWNVGEKPVEGFTSFAWVAIGAAVQRLLGIPPHISMVFIGIASWFALVVLIVPWLVSVCLQAVDAQSAQSHRLAATASIAAVLLSPQLALGAFNGLETALHALLFGAISTVVLTARSRNHLFPLVVLSLAAYATRPDAIAFIMPLWVLMFTFPRPLKRRQILAAFGMFAIALIIYSVAKWAWFGYPLPNTYYIKKGSGFDGRAYVGGYFRLLGPILLFLVYSVGRTGVMRLARDRTLLVLLFPSSFFCLAYVTMNPTMGHAYRFLVPTLPLFILACLRAQVLAQALPKQAPNGAVMRFDRQVIAAFCLALVLLTGTLWRIMLGDYASLDSYFQNVRTRLVEGGKRLEAATALTPPPLVATGEAGAVPYFSKLTTVDLIGLIDSNIAHHGLTHAYFLKRSPDILILQDLYLRPFPSSDDSGGALSWTIDGSRWWLDTEKYRRIFPEPAMDHSGAGSTYQVVTSPSFAQRYEFIGMFPCRDSQGYPLFLRRDYQHFQELVAILCSQAG